MKIIEEEFGTIKIGQNKDENWSLIDDSKQDDIWFHIKNMPSCHVIFSAKDNYILNKKDLKYIANLCKNNTKKSIFLKNIYINYTQIKNIKKGKEIGSVIIKNYKNIKI